MPVNERIERWIERFPAIAGLSAQHLQAARGTVQFPVLEAGAIAYDREGRCHNDVMCLDGRTRVYRSSPDGRAVPLDEVGAGETCLLTTQCLPSGGLFQAESVAEARTERAALPGRHVPNADGRQRRVPNLRSTTTHAFSPACSA